MSYDENFEKECENRVKNIAEELQELYDGIDTSELEEKLDDLNENEPEEPEQEENESDEDYDNRYEEWEQKHQEWEQEVEELEEQLEEAKDKTLRGYFDDYLDLDYIVDRYKRYEHCRVWIGIGGPNICIDTEDAAVKLYWGSTQKQWGISYSVRDEIDAIFEEEYNCF